LGEGQNSRRDSGLPSAARQHCLGRLKRYRNDRTGRRGRRARGAQSRGERTGRGAEAVPRQPGAESRLRPGQTAGNRAGGTASGTAEDARRLRVRPALQEAEEDRAAVPRRGRNRLKRRGQDDRQPLGKSSRVFSLMRDDVVTNSISSKGTPIFNTLIWLRLCRAVSLWLERIGLFCCFPTSDNSA
jgi:hypothetical protein